MNDYYKNLWYWDKGLFGGAWVLNDNQYITESSMDEGKFLCGDTDGNESICDIASALSVCYESAGISEASVINHSNVIEWSK